MVLKFEMTNPIICNNWVDEMNRDLNQQPKLYVQLNVAIIGSYVTKL